MRDNELRSGERAKRSDKHTDRNDIDRPRHSGPSRYHQIGPTSQYKDSNRTYTGTRDRRPSETEEAKSYDAPRFAAYANRSNYSTGRPASTTPGSYHHHAHSHLKSFVPEAGRPQVFKHARGHVLSSKSTDSRGSLPTRGERAMRPTPGWHGRSCDNRRCPGC